MRDFIKKENVIVGNYLKSTELDELITYYIEQKTGNHVDLSELFTVDVLDAIEEIEDYVQKTIEENNEE